jgi:hypothetical protein
LSSVCSKGYEATSSAELSGEGQTAPRRWERGDKTWKQYRLERAKFAAVVLAVDHLADGRPDQRADLHGCNPGYQPSPSGSTSTVLDRSWT